ncbi:MAG: response regulator [Gemmatimonadetes bacterium]|nr:response regulator [Gemmatimonadota bacterium]
MARVLLIDDDEEHRVLARRILESAGHAVDEAADGAMGLKSFGQRRPDVVLTDINMPRLDGHEVIAALRVQHKGVPVIAISGG